MPIASAWAVGLYEKALPAAWSWDQRLTATAGAGYSFAEISIDPSDERLARLAWPASARADLRRAMAASGVPILTMCLSAHRQYSLGSRVAATRERGLEIMRRAIDFSVDVGVRIVQVPGYDVFDEQPGDADTVARFMDGMHQAVEWAGQAGVMLALENVDVPMSESIVSCMEIVRQINSVWFQIYPDMANVTGAGYDPVTELAHCAGHLVAVHVKDCLPGTIRGVPFRAGIVPFDEVFRVLAALDFRGPLTVEMWADMDKTGDPVAVAQAARRFVADLIEINFGGELPSS
jgi:L-ribulose-5-phosphate 3-epimerase